MIFNKKNGFSLAELLIAIGIISVIATLGFSVAKKGIDKAYNLFIYTGYKGINTAILDANAHGFFLDSSGTTSANFYNHVINLLSGTGNSANFTTPKNISYSFRYIGQSKDPVTNINKMVYYVEMNIPCKKTSTKSSNKICLAYLPQDEYGILIPFDEDSGVCKSDIDLTERIDLLPFYIDDGLVGRSIKDRGYVPRDFYSVKDAICEIYTGNIGYPGKTFFTCSAGTKTAGVLKVVDPRKLR
jgi:prepilin-type N-terminal cleavage/methylation domain-containing protein